MRFRRWAEPALVALFALVCFVLSLWLLLGVAGCSTGEQLTCPPVPTPSTIRVPVQQQYPEVTIAPRPDCSERPEGLSVLDWALDCLSRVMRWGEANAHELEGVNAARITPTPTP